MGGVEQHVGAHLLRDAADLGNRVRKQVEAAADGDQRGADVVRQGLQRLHVDCVAVGVDGRRDGLQTVQASGSGEVVGDVTTDGRRGRDDAVAGPAGRHEGVEVAKCPRPHPDLRVPGTENPGREAGCEHLDLLDSLQPGLVLVSWVTQRGARTQASGQQRLGPGVHDVRGRVEVEAGDVVDEVVLGGQPLDLGLERVSGHGRPGGGDLPDSSGDRGGEPGAISDCHPRVSSHDAKPQRDLPERS